MSETLRQTIREAFADVTLGSGIGLRQAQGIDDYEPSSVCARLRAQDEKEDWSKISCDDLNRCHSSLSFFDPEGMRFHLPAFLIAELRGLYRFGMVFCLSHLNEHTIGQFALLTPSQRLAVRAFLLLAAESEAYKFDRPHILRALEEYWVIPDQPSTDSNS